MASSTEPGRIDYPVSHLNTCSLPFTGFLVYACAHTSCELCGHRLREIGCASIYGYIPDRMGTPAKILLIPLSVLWSGMKDRSSSYVYLVKVVCVDMCTYTRG